MDIDKVMSRKLFIGILILNCAGVIYFAVSLLKINTDISTKKLESVGTTFVQGRQASRSMFALSGKKEDYYLSLIQLGEDFWKSTIEGVSTIRSLSEIGGVLCFANVVVTICFGRFLKKNHVSQS